jgi:hypothetical protein
LKFLFTPITIADVRFKLSDSKGYTLLERSLSFGCSMRDTYAMFLAARPTLRMQSGSHDSSRTH